MAAALTVGPAWYRHGRDALAQWRAAQHREPSSGERAAMAEQIRQIKGGMARHEELTAEHHHAVLDFLIKNGRMPTGYPSNDRGENQQLVRRAMAAVDKHVAAYAAAHPHHSFLESLNPVKLISAAADVVGAVAPFVDMAISMVPGAGQIYSLAKAGVNIGTALAKGRPLTDAFIDSAVGMIPGGAIAQRAARAVVAVAKGRSLTGELVDQLKEQFPGAEHAITVATGIVHGRNLQDMAIAEVKGLAADQIKSLAKALPAGVDIPPGMKHGAEIGYGVLHSKTLTPAAALAVRARLIPTERQGFDRVMAMRAVKHARRGSPNVPRPGPSFRGATFVTREGATRIGEACAF